jgi:hypothetical protein
MTVVAVTSASVGTKLATSTDAHVTDLTMALPTSMSDDLTQLCLVDAAAAPTATSGPPRVLFAADLRTLASFAFGMKQLGPPYPAGGLTPPAWPMDLKLLASFVNGIFVQSCPAGVVFSLTTGP